MMSIARIRLSIRGLACAAVAGLAGFLLAAPAGEPAKPLEPRVDPLKHQGYVESISGKPKDGGEEKSARFEMVPVPGGVYLMGSPETEPGRNADEGPRHAVQVRPFWMGKCEVTWDEFDLYWKEKGNEDPDDNDRILKAQPDAITGPTPTYVNETYGHGREGHPVLCLSHHCAMEYCRWLSHKTGKVYRLPTEAEWEWAARAGTTTAYSFGDDPKDLGEYAWYIQNSAPKAGEDPQTHPVGTRKPNPWGLHDMYGNVMEWCLDHYQKDYCGTFTLGKIAEWPVLLPTDQRFSHVARGGSWSDPPARCRSAARRGSDKSWIKDDPQLPQSIWWLTRMDVIGFRVVRAVEEQENLQGLRSKVTRKSD
jgi:formylglycine-generating enzyme required for sulfatase activity